MCTLKQRNLVFMYLSCMSIQSSQRFASVTQRNPRAGSTTLSAALNLYPESLKSLLTENIYLLHKQIFSSRLKFQLRLLISTEMVDGNYANLH